MIACVSGIEYNISETLNTIKYASRARNIKNATKANAIEVGWDDVEHLQNTVLKLRSQLSTMDLGGKPNGRSPSEDSQMQSEKLFQRLTALQREHTEVNDVYTKTRTLLKANIRFTIDIFRSAAKICVSLASSGALDRVMVTLSLNSTRLSSPSFWSQSS